MKVTIVDITSRNAEQYNPALCRELGKQIGDGSVVLLAPMMHGEPDGFQYRNLVSLVPTKWTKKTSIAKRLLRIIEIVLNYCYIFFYALKEKPDVLHFQWLPFMDVTGTERHVLKAIKMVCPRTRIFLTVHNVYPHDTSKEQQRRYRERFKKTDRFIDGYLVHLNSCKKELIKSFSVDESKIKVAFHGVYVPEGYVPVENNNKKTEVVLFGSQTLYKGADILVDAIASLDEKYRSLIHATIMGVTEESLYTQYKDKANSLGITWVNRFVSNKELYETIGKSDIIILPYRRISQSGVLLLALSYRKPILTSKLPSFIETLEGYPDSYFFEPDNICALAQSLQRFLDGEYDLKLIRNVIDKLNDKYSWRETAKATLEAYKCVK